MPASSDAGMRVLFFGTYDAGRHPRVRVLQEGLAASGHEVLECNVPLGIDTSDRVRMLRRPWLAPILIARLGVAWWGLWRAARHVPPVDAVVVGYLGQFDVHLARRLWRGVPIILDHLASASEIAVDRAVSPGPLIRVLEKLDRAALQVADLVCVDTEEHLALLPANVRDRGVVVPVGAHSQWFSPPQSFETSPLAVIFYGLFTPLQGAPIIGEAIRLLAGEARRIRFTMVGRGQDFPATRKAVATSTGVNWVDWVSPEELPKLVASHQVCLGIFGTGPKAMRVVPQKVFQGAAAGCAIVTSDTPPQRRMLEGAAVYVSPGDPEALAEALRGLARAPTRLRRLRTASYRRAEESFRPAAVVALLRERLEAAVLSR
jgi:glycosyltransferase involved in cell wall biosynthesis